MTVKELKEILSHYDEDMEVKLNVESGIYRPIKWVWVKTHDIIDFSNIEHIKFVAIQ